MPPPLAYFLTWTTYGTWLPGDERGWVDGHDEARHVPIQEPDPVRWGEAHSRMSDAAVTLDAPMRQLVEEVITADCAHRGWFLHAVSARSNHVHVVVSAGDVRPEKVAIMFKAYCTRKLKKLPGMAGRKDWWTENASKRYLDSEDSLQAAIRYVNGQDESWEKE